MQALSRAASEDILRRNEIGRLACYSPRKHESYIVPISYRYENRCVYFACLPGKKLRYLYEHTEGVCFEVEEVEPDGTWSTVLVTGRAGMASGWERLQQGFPTMRRVSRGPLRTAFTTAEPASSFDDVLQCVLRPARITGRKDRWVAVREREVRMIEPVNALAGHLAG